MPAVRAGQRAIFDQLDLRVGVTHPEAAVRRRRRPSASNRLRSALRPRLAGAGRAGTQRSREQQQDCAAPHHFSAVVELRLELVPGRRLLEHLAVDDERRRSREIRILRVHVARSAGPRWSIIFWSLRHWLLFACGTPRAAAQSCSPARFAIVDEHLVGRQVLDLLELVPAAPPGSCRSRSAGPCTAPASAGRSSSRRCSARSGRPPCRSAVDQ